MTTRYVWFGSHGPFAYDDADNYEGEAISMAGLRADQIIVAETPTSPSGVLRLADISSFDSTVLSRAESANLSQSGVISESESRNDSQNIRVSVVESKLTSGGL